MKKWFFLYGLLLVGCQSTERELPPVPNEYDPKAALIQQEQEIDHTEAGLFYTSDLGTNWVRFSSGLPGKAVISGLVATDRELIAITDSHGVYKTAQGKNEWIAANRGLPFQIDINALAMAGSRWAIGTFRQGIFLSDNEGRNWKASATPFRHHSIRDLLLPDKQWLAATDEGIYQSTDQGEHWTQTGFIQKQANSLAILEGKLYAGVVDGVVISIDKGQNWRYILEDQTVYHLEAANGHLYALAMRGAIMRSNNGGENWEAIDGGLSAPGTYAYDLLSIGSNLLLAHSTGLYRSPAHPIGWSKLKSDISQGYFIRHLCATDEGLLISTIKNKLQ